MPARLPDVRRGRTPVRRRTPPDLCRTHGRGRTLRPAPPRGHGLPDAQHPARQHPAEHAAPPPAGDSLPRFGVAGADGTQPDGGGALARRQFTPARTGFDTFGGAAATPLPCPYAGARTGNPAPRRTHGISRSRDNPHHRKPAPQAGGALSHPSRLTWVAASQKNGLADCPVWERTSARYAFARRTPQRSRDEPFFRRRGRWKSLREKRTAPPFPHRMEICLALSAPLLQPVASTIQKNAHPNGCAFLHCLLASLYHWSIHSRKSACPVSLALSPARLVSSRRRRGSIAARANSQACPTNHLSSLSASTSGWNCNAST